MPKLAPEELQRVHIWLYARDVKRIEKYFKGNMKPSEVIRAVVRNYLDRIEAKALADAKPVLIEDQALIDEVLAEAAR